MQSHLENIMQKKKKNTSIKAEILIQEPGKNLVVFAVTVSTVLPRLPGCMPALTDTLFHP